MAKGSEMTLGPDRKTLQRWNLRHYGRIVPVLSHGSERTGDEGKSGEEGKGGAGKTGDDSGKKSGKAGDDPNVFVADDGTRYVRQTHVDALVGTARTEGHTKGKADRDAELQTKQLEDEQKFKPLYEEEKRKREAAEQALESYKTEQTVKELRRTIGVKHKLPPKLIDRLTGTTDAEIEADAKELAKDFAQSEEDGGTGATQNGRKAPRTEGGAGNRTGRGAGQGGDGETEKPKKTYSFQRPGDVPWG
jgi:hypothetical protein